SCTSADPAWSSSSTLPFNFRGTVGAPVFVHVDDDVVAASPFSIAVSPVTAPPNDTCATATALSLAASSTVSLTNAVHDDRPCTLYDSLAGDVVFSFTPSVTGPYSFAETSSANVDMWLKSSCGATTCLGEVGDPEVISTTLTAGQTYYLFVEFNYPGGTGNVTVSVTSP
ncbi:MAG: hypothetical protein JNJ54_16710, partial [Myxococcaceae bacterium]|nr:hypothetical protein [Myxococcaceae bacterium]